MPNLMFDFRFLQLHFIVVQGPDFQKILSRWQTMADGPRNMADDTDNDLAVAATTVIRIK